MALRELLLGLGVQKTLVMVVVLSTCWGTVSLSHCQKRHSAYRCERVATNFATVCARVENGFT
jgi:hypothetical protein